MTIISIFCILLTCLYIILMILYDIGWSKQEYFVPGAATPRTSISVIIPARNEADNIAACIEPILKQSYPKELFEIIVVDDHSTDNTADIIRSYGTHNVRCISLAEFVDADQAIVAYKKKAIASGIANCIGELIVTTDADCIAPENWLKNIAALYERDKPAMIIAPVIYTSDGSVLQQFQLLDFMSMQGISVASLQSKMGNMCNGANLAFSREAFEEVKGYDGTEHLASGDDYLLMTKMQKEFPGRIACLKTTEAIVTTSPQASWSNFIQQRIRWASKSGKYGDKKLTLILSLVYLFNFSILALFVAAIFQAGLWILWFRILLFKILIELFLLYPAAKFFNKTRQLIIFPLLQPLHIIYVVAAGFLGLFGSYQWKDRKVH